MWVSKVIQSASTERCRGTFPQCDTSEGPPVLWLELNIVSCRNSELFWNAEEKLVTLFLTSGFHFFPKWCTMDVLKDLFCCSGGRLCCAVASSHSSLLQRLGTRKPLGTLTMLHSSPKPLGLLRKSRWVHSLKQEVCREVSHGLSEQEHRRTKVFMASAAKFYVCFSVVRVTLLLSFIRHSGV